MQYSSWPCKLIVQRATNDDDDLALSITCTNTCCKHKNSWDNLYTNELTNHAHDPADTGTNWFEDSDAQEKVLEFLSDFLLTEQETAKTETSFLDLGTGNGDPIGSGVGVSAGCKVNVSNGAGVKADLGVGKLLAGGEIRCWKGVDAASCARPNRETVKNKNAMANRRRVFFR